MNPGNSFYKICYCLARAALSLFYPMKVSGRDNIPSGAAIICANHSSLVDPFLIAFVLGIKSNVHILGKAELFKIPVISAILKRLGMISVDREIRDVKTIRKTLGYLHKGEKIAIFPEGTRAAEDKAVTAKSGAVRIAEHAEVPIIPVFIPRKKTVFRRITVVIGEPYIIGRQSEKRTHSDYQKLSDILMEKITSFDPNTES